MIKRQVIGVYAIKIPQRGGRKAREARLEVKSKRVTILPPQRSDSQYLGSDGEIQDKLMAEK